MKKIRYRVYSIILIVMLVITVLPAQAFAENGNSQNREAVTRAPGVTEIKVDVNAMLGLPAIEQRESTNTEKPTRLHPYIINKIFFDINTDELDDPTKKQVYQAMMKLNIVDETLLKEKAVEVVRLLSESSIIGQVQDSSNSAKLAEFFQTDANILASALSNGISLSEFLTDYEMQSSEWEDFKNIGHYILSNEPGKSEESEGSGPIKASAGSDPFENVMYKHEKGMSAPFLHTSAAYEQVNLSTGELEYRVTDAILPGKNGLDLIIERKYSSADAAYYNISGTVEYFDNPSSQYKACRIRYHEYYQNRASNNGGLGIVVGNPVMVGIDGPSDLHSMLLDTNNAKETLFYSAPYYVHRYFSIYDIVGLSAPNKRSYMWSYPATPVEKAWELGPAEMTKLGFLDKYETEPGFLMVIKSLDRKDPLKEKKNAPPPKTPPNKSPKRSPKSADE